MAWVDIKKESSKDIHRVTEEAYELVFKEQGFEIVNKASTAQKELVQENVQPKAELPSKRQYTKRNSVSN